jgi:hypothetical protein
VLPSRLQGWRSWNCFLDEINHDRILGQAKALAAGPLLKAGYGRVGIDGGWVCVNDAKRASKCTCGGVGGSYHDAAGQPVVGRGRFPNLTELTAASHALGVKLDFYGNSCNCVAEEQKEWKQRGGNPLNDVAALHSYGMDGIKVDGCGPAHNISRWVDALAALPGPREMLLENCGDNHAGWSSPDVSAVSGTGGCGFQMYRVSSDIAPQFYSAMFNLQAMVKYLNVSRPGCWPYPDMLQVGSAKLSEDEARSHFAAWCISSAPLILGYDLTDPAAAARAGPIVGNEAAIRINQAWQGSSGGIVSAATETFEAVTNHGAPDGPGPNTTFPLWQVWNKPLGAGKAAVLLLNISPEKRDISVAVSSLGLAGAGTLKLSDVWTGAAVPLTGQRITAAAVPAHGSLFLIAERQHDVATMASV